MSWLKWWKKKVPLTSLKVSQDIEACIFALLVLEKDLGRRGGVLPGNLNDVVDSCWLDIPEDLRGPDTPVNKAEFAYTLQCGVLYLKAVRTWMKE